MVWFRPERLNPEKRFEEAESPSEEKRNFSENFGKQYGGWDFFKKSDSAKQIYEAETRDTKDRNFQNAQGT